MLRSKLKRDIILVQRKRASGKNLKALTVRMQYIIAADRHRLQTGTRLHIFHMLFMRERSVAFHFHYCTDIFLSHRTSCYTINMHFGNRPTLTCYIPNTLDTHA